MAKKIIYLSAKLYSHLTPPWSMVMYERVGKAKETFLIAITLANQEKEKLVL